MKDFGESAYITKVQPVVFFENYRMRTHSTLVHMSLKVKLMVTLCSATKLHEKLGCFRIVWFKIVEGSLLFILYETRYFIFLTSYKNKRFTFTLRNPPTEGHACVPEKPLAWAKTFFSSNHYVYYEFSHSNPFGIRSVYVTEVMADWSSTWTDNAHQQNNVIRHYYI